MKCISFIITVLCLVFSLGVKGQEIPTNKPTTESPAPISPIQPQQLPPTDNSPQQEVKKDTLPTTEKTQKAAPEEEVPQLDKTDYGQITEIKRQDQYNPKTTVEALKKGNFGKPVNTEKDSIHWNIGALFGLDFNQGTLTNWAAGGDHFSLSLMAKTNVYANYAKNRNSWDNHIVMRLGFLKTSSQGVRKGDDKLEIFSKYSYRYSKDWAFSFLGNFKSQFAKGYKYPDDSTVISHFLAPGYALGSIGLTFEPKKGFSMMMSPITSRFVIVNDQQLANEGAFGAKKAEYKDLGNDEREMTHPGRKVNYELGAYLSVIYKREILKNINWNTRLELYSNYLHNPQNIDIQWNSLLTFKVNKFFSASLTTELIYDDDIKYVTYAKNKDGSIKEDPQTGEKVVLSNSPRIQFKELIGIGLAYQL